MSRGRPTPDELMRLAIDVMQNSVNEPRGDGKPSPKVGAVIHKPDGAVETAARGELRHGDHAEFTLLERKNRSNLLEGSTLYTTLEPCAPGARNHPKLSCAERIVNARIKKVYVGIEDDDPTVAHKGINHLRENGIEVEMFHADLQQQISSANKEFIHAALERASKAQSNPLPNVSSALEHPIAHATADTLSSDALDLLQKALEESLDRTIDDLAPFLLKQGIYTKKDNALTPTGIGELLFGKRPRDTFHQAGLLATVRYPDGTEETHNFDGPMVLIPSELEKWLNKVLPLSMDRSHMERSQHVDLPMEVIREAVVNALVHRDYDIDTAKCQLVIDPGNITIKSPGAPIKPITLVQIQDFSAPMLSRNPKMHYIFNVLGLAEERGLGLRSLKELAGKHHLPVPRFSFEEPYLTLSMYRSAESATDSLPQDILDELSKTERSGWAWLATQEKITKTAYRDTQKLPDRTALNHLKHFADLGLIKKNGSGAATYYEVMQK